MILGKNDKQKREFDKKMAEYRRFLKNDFDWDYVYILRLLQYKLSRTRKCVVLNNIVPTAGKIAKQIHQVEKLLDRVVANRYDDQVFKAFHEKYGHAKMTILTHDKTVKAVPVTYRYPKETPRNSIKIRQEAIKLYKKADKMKVNDLKKAFDLMIKNIWGWWD